MNPIGIRIRNLFSGVLSSLVAVVAFTHVEATAKAAGPVWHSSLKRAAEIAAESKKPIFAVFRCVR